MPTSHLSIALVALLAPLAPPTAPATPDAGQLIAWPHGGAGAKGPTTGG